MAKLDQDQEPSMEEILASIRRIISDDDAAPEIAAPAPAEAEMSQDDLDALFDTPADPEPLPEPEPQPEASAELSQDDLDALFDAPMAEAEPEPEPVASADDVLDLTEDFAIGESGDAAMEFAGKMVIDADDLTFEEPEPAPEPEPEVVAEEPFEAAFEASDDRDDVSPFDEEGIAEKLLSPTTDAAVSAAFGNLAHTILSNNARTLEDLVGEMLRPMLKAWLDDNLPALVERLVRQEIERVSRGR